MTENQPIKLDIPNYDLAMILELRIREEMRAMKLDTLLSPEEYEEFLIASCREAWEGFAKAEISVETR